MTHEAASTGSVSSFPLIRTGQGQAAGLVAIIRRLAAARSIVEIMSVVTHAARELLSADGVTFVLRDGDLCHYADEDAIGPLWKGKRFPARACISGWCMEHASQVVIPDITKDERIPQDAYRPTFVKSLAMVPVGQEEPSAALGAYWASQHEASAEELELLQTVANAAALATALVQLHEQKASGRTLQRLAGGFAERLHELSAARRERVRRQRQPWAEHAKAGLMGIGLAAAAFGAEAPFATLYLAVAGAVLLGGLVGGISAALVGGVLVHWLLVAPAGEWSLAGPQGWALLTFWAVAAALTYVLHRLLVAQTRERVLNDRLQLIGEELQHRFKNFIAVTQALALQTSRTSSDHADFREKFTGRLQALGSAQSLLKQPGHSSLRLTELIDQASRPFRNHGQLSVGAMPDVLVSHDVGTGVALVINELATNALKHGALSTPDGRVLVHASEHGGLVTLVWQETGCDVSGLGGKGFGMRLIRSAIPRAAGTTHVEFGKEGLVCRIEFTCTDTLSH